MQSSRLVAALLLSAQEVKALQSGCWHHSKHTKSWRQLHSLWQGVYLHLISLAKRILGKQHTKKETICPCFPLALTSESVLERLKHVDKASEKICSAAIGLDFFPSKSLRMRVAHTVYYRCVLGGPSLQGSPGLNFWPSHSDKTRRDAMTQTLLFGLLTQNVGHWSAAIASGWLVGGCWLCPLPCL